MTNLNDSKKPTQEQIYAVALEIRKHMESMAAELPAPIANQLQEIMDFRTSLTSETDRGSALMAAAFLDDRIKSLLAARLVDDKKLGRRVFEFNGPLGTFSSRIDFSYLLGLLPKNANRDLHLLRSIRNKFAHIAAPIGFDHPEIKPLCDSLVFHGVLNEAGPGAKYRRSVMALLTIILEATNNAEHISPKTDALVPDRTDAYQAVSEIWAKFSNGIPYPVEHHHVKTSDRPQSESKPMPNGD
ncbi:hypothetical protein [Janthinobacterium sp. EB271-G4-7A]|uniref:hypothetical protein n=1 Tax=Janthinobacterium sp. EB271-G4-7A TaxID=2775056 RepID=UPI001E39000C|nr:hypothetical protein [Janthinobacterium sp. EB271-G4-7A]MCC7699044.1 hypothetical protein [Janthinobacterium sp. EB271-G4-7A]